MSIWLTKYLSKKFPKFERYISIPLILIFTIPPIFLTAFGGTIGSYIGMVFFAIIGGYTIFEVFKNMEMSKYSAIYFGLSILILFFFPWTNWIGISDFGTKETAQFHNNTNVHLSYLISVLFNWRTIILYFLVILVPILIDPKIRNSKNFLFNTFIIIFVTFVIGFFAKAIWIINNLKWTWILFFVSIAIIGDTFGFFGGMFFGKKWFNGAKLAPKISPKKTWAGFIIGYVFTAVFIGFAGWYMHIFKGSWSEIGFLVISVILIPIISPLGDLLFSGIKRYLGIKDFSNLLPGHGGAADRLDAMAFVMFSFVILFLIF